MECPFCRIESSRVCNENEHAVAIRDSYPLSPGHTLIIPKQHAACLFELSEAAQTAVWKLVAEVRKQLLGEFRPDGFNVALNDGAAAGQTVMHVHVHVIPRYAGDVPDPRGGVRWIIPAKAAYWKQER